LITHVLTPSFGSDALPLAKGRGTHERRAKMRSWLKPKSSGSTAIISEAPDRMAAGGQRLASMVAPTIGTIAGRGVLALRTPGSCGILQSQPQFYVNYLDYGLDLQAAIEAPRARLWDGSLIDPEAGLTRQLSPFCKIEVMQSD